MRKTPQRSRRGGFTLIEVLLVLVILGVLAAMVVPRLLGSQQKAMIDASKASIHGVEHALELYAVSNDGEYPSGNQSALSVLVEPVDRDGKAMKPFLDALPTDAWKQPLFYEYPNTKAPRATKPAIWSSGPNKQNEDGGGDDINNWTQATASK